MKKRLAINIAILKNCEQHLHEGKNVDAMLRMKVFAMARISELNRKLYSHG